MDYKFYIYIYIYIYIERERERERERECILETNWKVIVGHEQTTKGQEDLAGKNRLVLYMSYTILNDKIEFNIGISKNLFTTYNSCIRIPGLPNLSFSRSSSVP